MAAPASSVRRRRFMIWFPGSAISHHQLWVVTSVRQQGVVCMSDNTPTATNSGTRRYPYVFRPLQLGPATLRNRIFVPAHTTNYGEDNLPSDRHLAYHQARAAGGASMIMFE